MAVVLGVPLSRTNWQYHSINCALVHPILSLAPKITCALLMITGLVVHGSVSCASVSAWPLKACAVKGVGLGGGVGWAFLAACATYETPPLHTTGRVLIWQASVGQLAELAVDVG